MPAHVERVISQVATAAGGPSNSAALACARNNAWLKNRIAALNLRNLISRGLTRDNAAWVLT